MKATYFYKKTVFLTMLLLLVASFCFALTLPPKTYHLVFNTTGNIKESYSTEVRVNNTWVSSTEASFLFNGALYLNTPMPLIRYSISTNNYDTEYTCSITSTKLKNDKGFVLPYKIKFERGSAPIGLIESNPSDLKNTYTIETTLATPASGEGIKSFEVATLLLSLDQTQYESAIEGTYTATLTFTVKGV